MATVSDVKTVVLQKQVDSLEKQLTDMVDAVRRLGNQTFELNKALATTRESMQDMRAEFQRALLELQARSTSKYESGISRYE